VTVVRPRALVRGSRVAVVAPASPFRDDDLRAGLGELQALGFEPVVDVRVFARDGYQAGPAELRAAVIEQALEDPSIDALIGARGGYGSVNVLPLLDRERVRAARKAIIGYSDLTALLAWVTLGCGLVSFHGPTVAGRLARGTAGYDRDTFVRLLTEPTPLGPLEAPGVEVFVRGEAAGPLVGGTLTQLAASLGTPFAFDPPAGCVLFVEDVNERPYRLDRMLTQLRLAGVLERAAALVFGEMVGCDEPGGGPAAREVLARLVSGFPGPVLFGFPSGHARGPAWTLPFGVRVRVRARGTSGTVIVEEPAVG
jgi:muramoyltetrapeptide carboxypeptidase